MKRLVRTPLVLLLLQALAFGLALWATGRLDPERSDDTASYEEFPFDSLPAALAWPRTFGYPAFLKLAGAFAPSHRAVPVAQFVVHAVCVIAFYLCAGGVIRSKWTRMAAASTLLYSNVVLRYVHVLMADALASSLAILTVALLMRVVVDGGKWIWCGLAAGVFFTCQVRPAYLFLVPLVPLLGLALLWIQNRREESRRGMKGPAAALCTASVVPLVLFCGLRWLVVGHFGLVSFGANNMAGVVGVFLTEEMVDDLPADLRPLASAALKRRRELAASGPAYSDEVTLQYTQIEARFDANTWQVFVPAAREIYGDDPPRINSELRRLATAIVLQRPRLYAVWLAKAAGWGVYMIVSLLAQNPFYLALLLALLLVHAVWVVRRLKREQGPDGSAIAGDPSRTEWQSALRSDRAHRHFVEVNTMLLIAVAFAGAKLLLVIITSPPLGRFMDAAGMFFPIVLMQMLMYRLQPALRATKPL